MKRRVVMALLGVGAVVGFASGFHSIRHCQRDRRAAFEHHVAAVCVDAARHADQKGAAPPEE